MLIERRRFLARAGLAVAAAPFIVKASSLMPVRSPAPVIGSRPLLIKGRPYGQFSYTSDAVMWDYRVDGKRFWVGYKRPARLGDAVHFRGLHGIARSALADHGYISWADAGWVAA